MGCLLIVIGFFGVVAGVTTGHTLTAVLGLIVFFGGVTHSS